MRRASEHEPMWYDDHQVSFMPEIDSPKQNNVRSNLGNSLYQYPYSSCKKELDSHLQNYQITPCNSFQLPLLESPKLLPTSSSSMPMYGLDINQGSINLQPSLLAQDYNNNIQQHQGQNFNDQVTDWRVLDKFVASQLFNQGDASIKGNHDQSYPNAEEHIVVQEDASNSISSCPIDLWK